MKKLWKWLFGTRKQQCNIHDVINLGCGCTNNLYHSDNKEWCYKEQKRIKPQKQPCLQLSITNHLKSYAMRSEEDWDNIRGIGCILGAGIIAVFAIIILILILL